MLNRRTILKALGSGSVIPALAHAQQQPSPRRTRWEMFMGGVETLPAPAKPDWRSWSDDTITASWIGHATVLVNFFGTWILTDPVLVERIGIRLLGVATLGPKRLVAPALLAHELPPIDLLLVSHGHMDHLDIATLQQLPPNMPIVMAKNTLDILDNLAFPDVHELDWGERKTLAGVEIEAVQVRHFGWRYPWEDDRSKGVWTGRSYNAYLLSKNGRHIFFGGDTAMQEFFRPIGVRGIEVELAIMPIGAYDPWVYAHCNPEEAIAMAGHLHARVIMPVHWGTFIQSEEPTEEPIERFTKALEASPEKIALRRQGETWNWGGAETLSAESDMQSSSVARRTTD